MSYNLTLFGNLLKNIGLTLNLKLQDEVTSLTDANYKSLSDGAQELFIQSKTVFELNVIDIADNNVIALNNLCNATSDINKAIKTIQNVQNVISVTADLIGLSTAVCSLNFTSIVASSKDILTRIDANSSGNKPENDQT